MKRLLYSPRGEKIEGDGSPPTYRSKRFFEARKLSVRPSDQETYHDREKRERMILLLIALLSSAAHAETLNPSFAKSVDACKMAKPSAHIWFFKQWHLGPKLDTTDIKKSLSLPQEENQKAIFDQLDLWVSAGALKTIIAEGCSSGEMTEASPLKFNGWDIAALKAQAAKSGLRFDFNQRSP